MVSGGIRIVHSDLLHCYQKLTYNWNSVAQMSDGNGSLLRNRANSRTGSQQPPMTHSEPPGSSTGFALLRLPRNAARALIWLYRHTLSPLVGYNCRHLPTCSVYSDEAIERFGLWAGGWMTLSRLLRCQPFGTSGIDLVPSALPASARWYLPWRYGRWRSVNAPPSA
jgi:putative membrane protein insertion efficiency factor